MALRTEGRDAAGMASLGAMQSKGRADSPDAPENIALPEGVHRREALLLLTAFRRVKKGRFGRLVVTVSDARVVDIEVTEKVDRDDLKTL